MLRSHAAIRARTDRTWFCACARCRIEQFRVPHSGLSEFKEKGMAYLNENYLKLQAGYLFPEIRAVFANSRKKTPRRPSD